MESTGMRWTMDGAQAILDLRSVSLKPLRRKARAVPREDGGMIVNQHHLLPYDFSVVSGSITVRAHWHETASSLHARWHSIATVVPDAGRRESVPREERGDARGVRSASESACRLVWRKRGGGERAAGDGGTLAAHALPPQ
jgi:hypothetical protein